MAIRFGGGARRPTKKKTPVKPPTKVPKKKSTGIIADRMRRLQEAADASRRR